MEEKLTSENEIFVKRAVNIFLFFARNSITISFIIGIMIASIISYGLITIQDGISQNNLSHAYSSKSEFAIINGIKIDSTEEYNNNILVKIPKKDLNYARTLRIGDIIEVYREGNLTGGDNELRNTSFTWKPSFDTEIGNFNNLYESDFPRKTKIKISAIHYYQ